MFAKNFIITYTPSNPNYSKLFKWFRVGEQYPFLEGQFSSIDPYDSGKLVAEGVVTWYYPNGNVQETCVFSNGVGNGEYTTYYEDKSVRSKGRFLNGKLEGTSTVYYADGKVSSIENYKDGIFHGPYSQYDQNGTLIKQAFYENGLATGKLTQKNSNGVVTTYDLVTFLPSDGQFGATLNADYETYPEASSASFTTIGGEKILSVKQNGWKDFKFIRFALRVFNGTDEMMQCSVTDINVEFIKKDKPSKNKAVSEATMNSVLSGFASIMTDAYQTAAKQTAQQASTTQSYSNTGGYSNTNTAVAGASSTSSSGSGVAYGATGYANNTGYRSGSSSVGYGAYENNRNSAVAVAGSTSTSAQGYSNSTQRDGNAEYQIYQVEKQKADNQVKILNDTVLVLMTELQVSNFSVAPKQTASKSIYCSAADSRFDEVRVSFSLNGKPYTVTFK